MQAVADSAEKTSQLNKHLSSYMPGLTAKVFRTYNASYTMSKLLQDLEVTDASVAEKIKLYNDCNREVAILCNHKRTAAAGHEAQIEKLGDRVKGLKFQQWRQKMMALDLDPKQKKKKGAEYFEMAEDLTDEWVRSHLEFLVQEQRTKIEKKFQKDNEKLVAEGEKPMPDKELKERLTVATDLDKKLQKEYKSKKVEPESKSATVEKCYDNVAKLEERIKTLQLQTEDRNSNKEVALGTSKIVGQSLLFLLHVLTCRAELHRPSSDSRLLQEVQRTHREVLLQDAARQVQLGHQVRRGRCQLGVLILVDKIISTCTHRLV